MTWTCREIVNKPINLKFERKIKQYFSNDNNNKENKTSTPPPPIKKYRKQKKPTKPRNRDQPFEFHVGGHLIEVIGSKRLPLTDVLVQLTAVLITPSMIKRPVQREAILVAIIIVWLPWIPIHVRECRVFLRRQPRVLLRDVRRTQPDALYFKINQTRPLSYHITDCGII